MSTITNRFAWIVLGASIGALIYPSAFTWFSGNFITLGLGGIMLGMGLTLTPDDFKRIAKNPKQVFTGAALQYTVMPAVGYLIAKVFGLPPELAAGLILVSCCPGGTASNVISFLAKADVALSVSMTALSTMAAVALTPVLTTLLVGSSVEVDPWGLFAGTLKVVLLPVTAGLLLRKFLGKAADFVIEAAPAVAVILIALIVASIIGAGKEKILSSGLALIASVVSLHLFGFGGGYLFSRIAGEDLIMRRTVSIEVGMQNSGLGVVLARNNFADPVTAIPSAISSLTHSLIGSVLASIWRRG